MKRHLFKAKLNHLSGLTVHSPLPVAHPKGRRACRRVSALLPLLAWLRESGTVRVVQAGSETVPVVDGCVQ